MKDLVLDASAVLAVVNSEPGADIVAACMMDAAISAVNVAEVLSRLSDFGLDGKACRAVLAALNLRVIPFDEAAAIEAGELRAATRYLGLSLGDRACLALARSLKAGVVTADRNWSRLALDVEVRLIR